MISNLKVHYWVLIRYNIDLYYWYQYIRKIFFPNQEKSRNIKFTFSFVDIIYHQNHVLIISILLLCNICYEYSLANYNFCFVHSCVNEKRDFQNKYVRNIFIVLTNRKVYFILKLVKLQSAVL